MDLKVLGCHGGESPKHQCPAFLIEGRVCLDAGSITSMLTLKEQQKIEAVVVSHAHMDHVRDLAMLADTRTQQGGPPLVIASTPGTISVLKRHFFNDRLWPDFSRIPGGSPTVVFQALKPGKDRGITLLIGVLLTRPMPVTIPALGVSSSYTSNAASGDNSKNGEPSSNKRSTISETVCVDRCVSRASSAFGRLPCRRIACSKTRSLYWRIPP